MTQLTIVYIIGALLLVLLACRLLRAVFRRDSRSCCRGCPLAKECKKGKVPKQ